jgi:hypothetical protein
MSGAIAAQAAPEYALKAAYVYNFALFTAWPPESLGDDARLTMCVRPDHPLRGALDELKTRSVKGRRIQVKTWDANTAEGECQIVVLERDDRDRWNNWRRHVQLRGVLSISEEDSGLPNTVITMGLDNDRLVFNVQIDIARQAGLAISARLLQLARVVQ